MPDDLAVSTKSKIYFLLHSAVSSRNSSVQLPRIHHGDVFENGCVRIFFSRIVITAQLSKQPAWSQL